MKDALIYRLKICLIHLICFSIVYYGILLNKSEEGLSFGKIVMSITIGLVFYGVSISYYRGSTIWLKRVWEYRYCIILCLMIVFVLLRLNNSSIYILNRYFRNSTIHAPLWGRARDIRSDEYAVWTPFLLSQEKLGFPAINSVINGGKTDVSWISVGGLPAYNLATLFRPFYWGFLLFGAERGFSLLTALRWICLFLVSEKCAEEITKDVPLSITISMLLTLSPIVQWWFSQSISEVMIYGFGLVYTINKYCKEKQIQIKVLLSILSSWLLGCFIMVAYPSWIISVGYLIIALSIMILRKYTNLSSEWKTIILPFIICITFLVLIVWSSRDVLLNVVNSVYPGNRINTGGVVRDALKTGLYSLLFPFITPPFYNSCGLSNVVSFAPAGLILCIYHTLFMKNRDGMIIIVVIVESVFWLFQLIGIPVWLAKATLLSQCTRPELVVGICDLILLAKGLSKGGLRNELIAYGLSAVCAAVCTGIIWQTFHPGKRILLLLLVLYSIVFILLFTNIDRKLCCILLCGIAVLSGGFVNPIQRGLSIGSEVGLIQTLDELETNDDGLYAIEGSFVHANALLASGKRIYNSTQVYPNTDRWKLFDESEKKTEIYNRFCHKELKIEDVNRLALLSFDLVEMDMTIDDLRREGVDYIITRKDLGHGTDLKLIAYCDEWKIYGFD